MIQNNPKISIITPSYNQSKFIEQTILSVINQNYDALEYIIIDGGSDDGSIDIIKKYENELTYWESTPDRGQAHAINKGLDKATGEIIGYLNSDDRYLSNTLNIVGDIFIKNPNIMWIAGNVIFTDELGKYISKKKPIYSKFILHFASSSIYQPSVFIRRKVLNEVGFLNKNFYYLLDQEWFSRIAERYEPKIIDLDFSLFRWQSNSKSFLSKNLTRNAKLLNERVNIAEKYLPSYFVFLLKKNRLFTINLLMMLGKFFKVLFRIKKFPSMINENTSNS